MSKVANYGLIILTPIMYGLNEYFIHWMISNVYALLIIYARIDLTPIYIVCFYCLLVVEEVINKFKLKLESSIGIYFNRLE